MEEDQESKYAKGTETRLLRGMQERPGDTDLIPGPEGKLQLIHNDLSVIWPRSANFQHGFIPYLL